MDSKWSQPCRSWTFGSPIPHPNPTTTTTTTTTTLWEAAQNVGGGVGGLHLSALMVCPLEVECPAKEVVVVAIKGKGRRFWVAIGSLYQHFNWYEAGIALGKRSLRRFCSQYLRCSLKVNNYKSTLLPITRTRLLHVFSSAGILCSALFLTQSGRQ